MSWNRNSDVEHGFSSSFVQASGHLMPGCPRTVRFSARVLDFLQGNFPTCTTNASKSFRDLSNVWNSFTLPATRIRAYSRQTQKNPILFSSCGKSVYGLRLHLRVRYNLSNNNLLKCFSFFLLSEYVRASLYTPYSGMVLFATEKSSELSKEQFRNNEAIKQFSTISLKVNN